MYNPQEWCEASFNWQDVKTLKPDWDEEKCEEFLTEHEDKIYNAMIDEGWAVIQHLTKGVL
jgi:hypothetical protein